MKNQSHKLSHEIVADPFVGPTGKACALISTTPRRLQVIVNGKEGQQFDEVDETSVVFSADESAYAYFARRVRAPACQSIA